MTVSAYILINVQNNAVKPALDILSKFPPIKNVSAITGPYDIVALIEAEDMDTLGELITTGVHSINGIQKTLTCMVLRL